MEWQNFDLVNIKYVKFDNVKSLIFTKLESSSSQKGHAKCTKWTLEVTVT